jgi:hypothetical protein
MSNSAHTSNHYPEPDSPSALAVAIADPFDMLRKLDAFDAENRLLLVYPDDGPLRRELYPKHAEFFAAGAAHDERAFIGGNRTGKSFCVC